MKTKKILIVDDEYLAIENMTRLLRKIGYKDFDSTTSSVEAIEICKDNDYALIFLDINMPIKDGLEAAKEIRTFDINTPIVFSTAYSEYALKGFEVGAIDYIMKPINIDRLKESLERVFKEPTSDINEGSKNLKILVKYHERIFMIESDNIIYVEAQLNDSIAYTSERAYFTGKRISEMENLLISNSKFIKVHRSCIVNLDKVDFFETIEQGKYCIHFKNSKNVVYTSRKGAQSIREYFHDLS
ncbi:MAG: LytTR family DNA-binding domain-containing protein [Campylobacterota bacterium]|nr:LytTR family DNA-binding domain-containing protein [Campylobacterota bacterium]